MKAAATLTEDNVVGLRVAPQRLAYSRHVHAKIAALTVEIVGASSAPPLHMYPQPQPRVHRNLGPDRDRRSLGAGAPVLRDSPTFKA